MLTSQGKPPIPVRTAILAASGMVVVHSAVVAATAGQLHVADANGFYFCFQRQSHHLIPIRSTAPCVYSYFFANSRFKINDNVTTNEQWPFGLYFSVGEKYRKVGRQWFTHMWVMYVVVATLGQWQVVTWHLCYCPSAVGNQMPAGKWRLRAPLLRRGSCRTGTTGFVQTLSIRSHK